nr:UPF0481 protein At3g47200-like [Ipomoea batatas]
MPKESQDQAMGNHILGVLYKYGSSTATANTSNGKVAQTLIDMLLLENQIPFSVLVQLHKLKPNKGDDDVALLEELIELVKNCYEIQVGKLTPLNAHPCKCKYKPENLPKHLLELVHSLCGSHEYCGLGLQQQTRTATELKNSGVSFEKNDEKHSLFDIRFKEDTIKIRGFKIDEFTETFLKSMIAYEQHPDNDAFKYFTDFVLFMNKLIDTPNDAKLLCEIIGNFGTNKVLLFSELCGGIKASSTSTFSGVTNKQEGGDYVIDITVDNQTKNGDEYIIPRVAEALSKTNPSAYKPMLISIGPYYRKPEPGSENDIKKEFQEGFLGNTKGLKEKCREKLANIVGKARSYYSTDSTKDMSNEEFVEMLMVDGCFILQFLKSVKDKKCKETFMKDEKKVAQTLRDMILLENQIPFFVLVELHKLKQQDKVDEVALRKALMELVVNCYESQVSKLTPLLPCKFEELPKHLHEVIYRHCIPTNTTRSEEDDQGHGYVMKQINTATELEKTGISFQKIEEVRSSLFDIDFKRGTMKIRCFRIDDFTEPFLRNMIAYEQHSNLASNHFSDFVLFMSHLINTSEDVKLLRGKGILAGLINRSEANTNLSNPLNLENIFSQLPVGINTSTTSTLSTLSGVINKVSLHSEKPLEIWMGKLRQVLQNGPWTPMVGIVTLIATIFSIVHYTDISFVKAH